jgi:DNA segregation ATPase FtsK/SpoIIIE, S-DNA-T family
VVSKTPGPRGKVSYGRILGIQSAARRWHADLLELEKARFQEARQALRARLMDFSREVAEHSPDWSALAVEGWQPASEPPALIKIGSLVGPSLLKDLELPFTVSPLQCRPLLIRATPRGKTGVTAGIQSMTTRFLSLMPPSMVRLTFVDPVGLGRSVAQFMELAEFDDELVTGKAWVEPAHIEQRLADLTQHIENVNQKYLRNEFSSLEDYNRQAGRLAEAYRLVLVFDFPVNFSETAARRLSSIIKNGPRCGIFTIIVADMDVKLPYGINLGEMEQDCTVITSHDEGDEFTLDDGAQGSWAFKWDPSPPRNFVDIVVKAFGARAKDSKRIEVPFVEVAPTREQYWRGSTARGVQIPLGPYGVRKVQSLELGEGMAQHVLVAGKTGSGKSTLWHTVIMGAALAYSPDEIELYLIDFKKGVEFKCYAAEGLPHARVIAIESEREFGLSVLKGLDEELDRRGKLFRDAGVENITAYREAKHESMPRMLLIVDEFHEFFTEDDNLASQSSQILDRLVRTGRAFGVHVMLGSQTIAGAYNLARSTIDQMAVRIALQCSEADARLILADDNPAARRLSRPGEAVYNASNGLVEGNNNFQIAWQDDDARRKLLMELRDRPPRLDVETRAPIVFEGNAPARADSNRPLRALTQEPSWDKRVPAIRIWLGEPIAIADHVEVRLRRQSGGNVLIVGHREDLAVAMLANAVLALATQVSPSTSQLYVFDFSLVDAEHAHVLRDAVAGLPHSPGILARRDITEAVHRIAQEVDRRIADPDHSHPPVLLVVSGLQRARDLRPDDATSFAALQPRDDSPPLSSQFSKIVREGPELGIYTLAWCDTYANLNRTLERRTLRDFGIRIAFQMSAEDSVGVIDSPAASKLGMFRALLLDENEGRLEKFRPYGAPEEAWLATSAGGISRTYAELGPRMASADGHDEHQFRSLRGD